jgi:hypothetical protein
MLFKKKIRMRPIGLLLIFTLIFTSCEITDQRKDDIDAGIINVPASANQVDAEDIPEITFEDLGFDFGVISQGEKITHTYRFKNTGKSDLVIVRVEGSCGCTIMKGWPKHPVKPGEKGKIDVIFDSVGKRGVQNKTISVVANTVPSTTVLKLDGKVAAPDIN